MAPNLSNGEIQGLGNHQRAKPLLAWNGTKENLDASGKPAETILAPSPEDGQVTQNHSHLLGKVIILGLFNH